MSINNKELPVTGAGLGLRRGLIDDVLSQRPDDFNFMEVAPENWIGVGGKFGKKFREVAERYTITTHGLSLSLGGPAPLDEQLLLDTKAFLESFNIPYYTEHLSYCGDHGQLYDLMPIPFTEEAVEHVSKRIRRAQEILERRIAVENVSYYAAPGAEMTELEFVNAVLQAADCDLLLDVNNIWVNSINHQYDPDEFLAALPNERIRYIHVAGHYNEAEDLRVDTHGADVIDPVWNLLRSAYRQYGVLPTLLERDFNFPPLETLLEEVQQITTIQQEVAAETQVAA